MCARPARRVNGPGARRPTFATTTNALRLELREWLVGERVSLVVIEATGD